jgi:hypothetical protein
MERWCLSHCSVAGVSVFWDRQSCRWLIGSRRFETPLRARLQGSNYMGLSILEDASVFEAEISQVETVLVYV